MPMESQRRLFSRDKSLTNLRLHYARLVCPMKLLRIIERRLSYDTIPKKAILRCEESNLKSIGSSRQNGEFLLRNIIINRNRQKS